MSIPALSISQLCKTYEGGFVALKSIDLTVEQGDFFALLGSNGAGKSTAIGIICSLVNKTSGKVAVFGYDLDTHIVDVKRQIGLVPQEYNFNQFEPVGEIVINQAGFYGIPRHEAVLKAKKSLQQLELWDKRHDESRSLSGGMKRRLMIARALVHEPKLLILDEPTAGVDIEIRRSMWTFLKKINEQGTTIILTTHYLEEAESLCRHIAIIDHGEIVERSGMAELLSRVNTQCLILNSEETLPDELDKLSQLSQYFPTKIDSKTMELSLNNETSLNQLFDDLSQAQITVSSFRNKQNRLEQLFIERLQQTQKGRV